MVDEFEIPSFTANDELDSFVSDSAKDPNETENTDTKTEKLTKSVAKSAIEGSAQAFTSVISRMTGTDASLTPIEYDDLGDKLAPIVLKIVNSPDGLPKWVAQLLMYAPYGMAAFGVLMFGISVRCKVRDEKQVQREMAKRESEKDITPKKTNTEAEHGD
jgi:hypothetical protein